MGLSHACFALCMITIGLMVIVYRQKRHDETTAVRKAARAKAQRIREIQANALERQLERDKMFDRAAYYEIYEDWTGDDE